jgi:hypothetical protein
MAGFQVQLRSVNQLTQANGVKCIVYGKAKIGKTMLVGTAPRPVIISAERGLLSLRKDFGHLPGIEITCLQDLINVHAWAFGSAEAKQFDTICLDSISEIAEVVLIAAKEQAKADAAKTRKGVNGFQAYTDLNDQIMKVFRDFRDFAHKHVLFIAKEEWDKDEQTGMYMFRPSMPGKQLTMQLPYMFDEIFQINKFKDNNNMEFRALRTRSDNQNVAGDRSGRLDEWERPDLGSIFQKILA